MANEQVEAVLRQSLNLSYKQIELQHPDWSKVAVDDYFYKQSNINNIAGLSDGQTDQIETNTENISTNAANIVTNANNIGTNTNNITSVTNAFNTHNGSDSQHGVTGDNVGNGDFATAGTGGVVNEAANVADAVASTVSVTSPDATDLPTVITLANETKADVNQLVTDLNNTITQLNAFLAANKTANQMAS